jgi:hypothetical protein
MLQEAPAAPEAAARRHRVHFILNSKGGVGKSFISSLIVQREIARDRTILCFDGDATTATLSSFPALKATRLEMMLAGSIIDSRRLDDFVEPALTGEHDVLLDSGASTYAVLTNYALENDLFEQIHTAGKEVVVHAIVAGYGPTLRETLGDLDDLATQLPSFVTIIVWLNENWGEIRDGGKGFEDMAVYQQHRERIAGIVRLAKRNPQTFGVDLDVMMRRRLTFLEVPSQSDISVSARHRLRLIAEDAFRQLDVVLP